MDEQRRMINILFTVITALVIMFASFDFLTSRLHEIQESNVKTEKQLKDYNDEHNTSFKDLYDVVETIEYTTHLSVSEKTVKSGLFGSENLIKRVTFTNKKGDNITIDYNGDLPLGDYKSGKVIEKYYPFRERRKTRYGFKEQ